MARASVQTISHLIQPLSPFYVFRASSPAGWGAFFCFLLVFFHRRGTIVFGGGWRDKKREEDRIGFSLVLTSSLFIILGFRRGGSWSICFFSYCHPAGSSSGWRGMEWGKPMERFLLAGSYLKPQKKSGSCSDDSYYCLPMR
ncbi:hypothetical protein VTN00DRAFT_1085 [Thermoascus crustaceus]|uniref:uncharacterized protein n=1 Tax=Thermoascus crustaceus TaxID=5088 RepID=UPI003741ED35